MSRPTATSRRDFLKAASLTSAVFGTSETPLLGQETRRASENNGLPRNVIFMVSDGMNHGALALAQHYLNMTERRTSHWMGLYRDRPVVRSLVETFSANSLVTDSAAASSAWGGGYRVDNGRLNVTPDGQSHAPLQTKLKQARIQTGLVSTATITHATPAGFAVNQDNRGAEADIALQYADRGVPVLLGGGQKFFPDEMSGRFARDGYDVLKTRADLQAARPDEAKPVLGTFAAGYLPYAIDWKASESLQKQVPPLDEMARFAIRRLDALSDHGWFLMVEGARIDHCGHANDAAGSIHEQIAFDDAVGAMTEYVAGRRDTLLIITTDHGCGGIQLNGVSGQPGQAMAPGIYGATTDAFRRISGFKNSLEAMKDLGGGLSGPPLRDFVKEHTGLELSDNELKAAQGLKSLDLGALFSKHHGIAWTSGNHTGELVEFCALGPGSHLFPAFMKNADVHTRVLRAFGLG